MYIVLWVFSDSPLTFIYYYSISTIETKQMFLSNGRGHLQHPA
jgi:hypothetical protein